MSRRLLFALAAVALVFAVAPPSASAQLTEQELQIVDIDTSDYPVINVVVDVPRGFADTTLTDEHFSLEEGGVSRALAVDKLDETTGIVLAIDTSGSMSGQPISVAKTSALSFLDGLPSSHPVAIIGFGDIVSTASELTTDRADSRAAIQSLVSRGETSLYDGLIAAADVLSAATTDRVALVVLSDGADTISVADEATVAAALRAEDISLYSIGLETGESRLTDLAGLTEDVGGSFLSTTDLADLSGVYDGLAARLANQYRLSFTATSAGPVEVQVVVTWAGQFAVANHVAELAPGPGVVSPTPGSGDVVDGSTTILDTVPFTAPAVELLEEGWVIWAGLGGLFFAFSVAAYAAFSMAKPSQKRRLEPRVERRDETQVSGVANWAGGIIDRVFLNTSRRGAINAALDRAGLDIRPGEFLVLTGSMAVVGFGLGWLFHPFVGLGLGLVISVGARFFVSYLGSRRRNRFANQLDNTLLVIASSLRAGHGIQRALAAVAEESESPTREEFTRVVAETRIGRDLVEALQSIVDRLGNQDFEWVVRAVAINRELGGNLAEVLDNVGTTIRERNQLRRQISALSAEGKLSAMILYVLPFGVAGFIRMTNPKYLGELTASTAGIAALVLAGVLMIGGGAWIKKIVQVRF